MNKLFSFIASGALLMSFGVVVADNHEGDAEEANVASPMEMWACKYNEGKGPADLDAANKKWNAWADKQGVTDYSAWTLVPYYSGPDQDFDVLWFGAADTAKALGRAQDMWIAKGSKEAEAFAEAVTCHTHAAYSVLMMKQPPQDDDNSSFVVTFSDCDTSDGVTFDDLYMPIKEWGEYRAENGSKAGHWIFFPSFGGGNEDFDFKWVTTASSFEELGADWDQMNESGWQKANELFQGKLRCDSSRAYIATTLRSASDDE